MRLFRRTRTHIFPVSTMGRCMNCVALLSFGLSFSLMGVEGHARQGRPWGRREKSQEGSILLGKESYEKWQQHLGAVSALSKRYWLFLACMLWQQECEEEVEEEKEILVMEEGNGASQVTLEQPGKELSSFHRSEFCIYHMCKLLPKGCCCQRKERDADGVGSGVQIEATSDPTMQA